MILALIKGVRSSGKVRRDPGSHQGRQEQRKGETFAMSHLLCLQYWASAIVMPLDHTFVRTVLQNEAVMLTGTWHVEHQPVKEVWWQKWILAGMYVGRILPV